MKFYSSKSFLAFDLDLISFIIKLTFEKKTYFYLQFLYKDNVHILSTELEEKCDLKNLIEIDFEPNKIAIFTLDHIQNRSLIG